MITLPVKMTLKTKIMVLILVVMLEEESLDSEDSPTEEFFRKIIRVMKLWMMRTIPTLILTTPLILTIPKILTKPKNLINLILMILIHLLVIAM